MYKYFSTAYKFGILGGLISVVSFFLLSFLRPDPSNLNLVFGYVLTPIVVFLAIKFFKEYTNGKYLSFAEGMSVGFVSYVSMAIVSGLGIWVILLAMNGLFRDILTAKLQILSESKELILSQVGEASYEITLKSIESMTALDIAINDSIWKIISGMFFTIIISIILRRNPN